MKRGGGDKSAASGYSRDDRLHFATLTTRASLVNQAVTIGCGIAQVPICISILGRTYYGAWLAMSAIIAWFGMADLGMTSAIINRLAASVSGADVVRSRSLISTMFVFLLVVGVAITLLITSLMPHIPVEGLVGLQQARVGDIRTAAILLVVFNVGGYFLQTADAASIALQRGFASKSAASMSSLATIVGLCAVWRLGFKSVTSVVLVTVVPSAAARIAVIRWHVRSNQSIRLSLRYVSIPTLAELLGDSGLFFVAGVAELAYTQGPLLVIAYFAGASNVPLFAIPYQMFFGVYLLLSYVSLPLWPAIAEAMSSGDNSWIERTYIGARIRTAVATVALLVPVVVIARPAIQLWVGSLYVPPWWMCVILGLHMAQFSWNTLLMVFITGAGGIRARVMTVVLLAVSGIVLSSSLVMRFGARSAVIGLFVSMMISQTLSLPHILRSERLKWAHPTL